MHNNDTQHADQFGIRHPRHSSYVLALIDAVKIAWRSDHEGAAIVEIDGTDHWALLDDAQGGWEVNRRDEHGRWLTVHRFEEKLDGAASAMLAHDCSHGPGAVIATDRFVVAGDRGLAVAA